MPGIREHFGSREGGGPAFGPEFAPERSLSRMHADAAECERCDLYRNATQVVFGEGPRDAEVMLVGEQPGDREDLAGRPFVGPAGRLLDECLQEAGLDRSQLYLTNAVKHFKFQQRGKRRLHAKPNAGEIQRCAWWLGGELALIRPKLVVALGATAVYALLGTRVRVMQSRGAILPAPDGFSILVTVHPSSLLRNPDRSRAAEQRRQFVDDLAKIESFLESAGRH